MSEDTETKIEDPTTVTIKVSQSDGEDNAPPKVYGPKPVSEKKKRIPPAAQLTIRELASEELRITNKREKKRSQIPSRERQNPINFGVQQVNNPGQLIAIPLSSSTRYYNFYLLPPYIF